MGLYFLIPRVATFKIFPAEYRVSFGGLLDDLVGIREVLFFDEITMLIVVSTTADNI